MNDGVVDDAPDDWTPGYPVDLRTDKLRQRAHAQPLGDVEYLAARIVARLTGAIVTLQDDNRGPQGKPDIRVVYRDGRTAEIEVVTDIDPGRAAVTQASRQDHTKPPGGRLASGPQTAPLLMRVWWVGLSHTRSLKKFRTEAEDLLGDADRHMLGDQLTITPNADTDWKRRLCELGVTDIRRGARRSPGEIHLLTAATGGSNIEDEPAFLEWICTYLTSPARSDVRQKLDRSSAGERHCFIGCSDSTDWSLIGPLEDTRRWIPAAPPALPPPITHLWLFNVEAGGRCLHYSAADGWIDVQTHWRTH